MVVLKIEIKGETRESITRLLAKVGKEIATADHVDYTKVQIEGRLISNWLRVDSDGEYRWEING